MFGNKGVIIPPTIWLYEAKSKKKSEVNIADLYTSFRKKLNNLQNKITSKMEKPAGNHIYL